MKTFLVGVLVSLSFSAWGQGATGAAVDKERAAILRQGALFSVKIVPGDRGASLFVLGTKAVELKRKKLGVEAFIKVSEGELKPLRLRKAGDHYLIEESFESPTELKIKVEQAGKSEDFEFKLK